MHKARFVYIFHLNTLKPAKEASHMECFLKTSCFLILGKVFIVVYQSIEFSVWNTETDYSDINHVVLTFRL